jgi:hypothetical protein
MSRTEAKIGKNTFYLFYIVLLSLAASLGSLSFREHFRLSMNSGLTFASINCNSLNCSVASRSNQNLKINGITKLGSDIIFIADLRLSTRNLVSCADEVKKLFNCNLFDSYELIFNSTRNKRGVGILINRKICLDIDEEYRDEDENVLLIRGSYKGDKFILGSIYGPNESNEGFFTNLTLKIQQWQGEGGGVGAVRGRLELHYECGSGRF